MTLEAAAQMRTGDSGADQGAFVVIDGGDQKPRTPTAAELLAAFADFGDLQAAMGVTVWYFQRARPGELCSLAHSAMDAFIFKRGRLSADAEGFVRYAEVVVSLKNRRAEKVLSVGFFQCRALEDGRLDRDHYDEIIRTAPVAAFGWLQLEKPPVGVVEAEHRFAQRRLEHLSRWKPTEAELRLLRDLVNRRAARELL